jgi:sarcosine oxidase
MAGERLLVECGGIDAGPEGSPIVRASEKLAGDYGQVCEMMTGAALNQRYPHYNLPANWEVAYQPGSGFVRPDATRTFLHAMARTTGARLLHDTRVIDINMHSSGVTLRTEVESVSGDMLIVAAGSWLPRLLPELEIPLATERRVLAWFKPERSESLSDGRLPIFLIDSDGGWYGMPTPEGMLKLGHDKHFEERINSDESAVKPGDADAAKLMPCVESYFKGFSNKPVAMKTCIYTITPDHHFIIDRHPSHENVILFSCCSGHGFKYAPAYGAIALDLVAGKPREDLAVLGIRPSGNRITRYVS